MEVPPGGLSLPLSPSNSVTCTDAPLPPTPLDHHPQNKFSLYGECTYTADAAFRTKRTTPVETIDPEELYIRPCIVALFA